MDEPVLELEAYAADGSLRVVLAGALVEATTARLRAWLHAHLPATADLLVLDLSGLRVVDAVGLGALLAAHRRLGPGARVELEGPSDGVTLALRRSGLLVLPRQGCRVLRQQVPQQVSRTAPTMAAVTTSTSDGLLTNGGIA